jgi:hypothetical protein
MVSPLLRFNGFVVWSTTGMTPQTCNPVVLKFYREGYTPIRHDVEDRWQKQETANRSILFPFGHITRIH